jgi:hypothetical protein
LKGKTSGRFSAQLDYDLRCSSFILPDAGRSAVNPFRNKQAEEK